MPRARLRRLPLVASVVLVLAACAAPPPTDPPAGSPSASDRPIATDRAATEEPIASSPPPPPGPSAIAWERLDDAPFARLEMAVAAHRGRIWLAGGLSATGQALDDVDVFDPGTGAWSDGPSLPTGLHHAALVSDGDRLLLVGGYLGAAFNRPTELVFVLPDGAVAWEEGPALPEPRAAGAAAWDGSRVLYGGGVGAGGIASGVVSEILALTNDAWTIVGGLSEPREHLAATSDGVGRTWFLGGRVGGLDTNLAAVDLVDETGVRSIGEVPTPRGGVAAFHVPGIGACLTGGEAPDRAFATVECIDASGATTSLPDLLDPHHGHGAVVVSGRAYVLLGGPEPTLSAGAVVETLDLDALADRS